MTTEHGAGAPLSRLDWLWVVLLYVLLATCAVFAWTSGELVGERSARAAVAAVVLAGWHTWWVVLHPGWPEVRPAPMVAYFLGLVALAHYLTALSFAFFPVYLVSYPMAFVALPGRWAYAGVGLTAAVALAAPPLGPVTVEGVIIGLGTAVLVALAGGTIRALETETARRKAAMAELQRTHDDLRQALVRNLDLQDRLRAEARQSGVAAERARLAGEIHDTLSAGLAGILSQLEALDAELPTDRRLRGRVRVSTELARETLQEARSSVQDLRSGPLADATLQTALAEVAGRFERDHGVPVTWVAHGEDAAVPEPVGDTLVRAAQEALANVARHASATAVHLTLSSLGDTIILDVADDGIGFPVSGSGMAGATDPAAGTGHGLAIMRERVAALSGRVEVASAPGHGTTVTVVIPLADGTDDD